MTVQYLKEYEDGKVRVVEVVTTEKQEVKDLYELKKRKVELEATLIGWHARFVEQKRIELERAGAYMSAEMTALQAELDQVNSDIAGAIAAGVVEVIPPEPVPEPPVETIV